jgi:hypothetical protein
MDGRHKINLRSISMSNQHQETLHTHLADPLEILLVRPEISLTSVVKCFGVVVVE